eukprot:CAMPEP_0202870958 /NCGR_PEP_ID=MMETSP1391-20130828/17329_1 /ASSEMBLY_ACC=CAM_ASM_000867 /TAXON_ID=1034604 /ORGANISM="Chlamydomonas leiostraca, Strain SAG 11-49" /LENGTH=180 /DNA_ID=CAMNT_0049551649 /DNA_START=125 /DNA_END=663 /DNA_ORIENTATION=-
MAMQRTRHVVDVLHALPPSQQTGKNQATSSKTEQQAKGARIVPLPAPSTTVFKEGEFVQVGRVAGAFGVRGEVRVEISTDSPKQRYGKKGNTLYLRAPAPEGLLARMQQGGAKEQGMLKVTTVSAKVQVLGKGVEAWLVTLQEITDRTQAEALLDYTIWFPSAAREALRDPDEFWVQELA